MTREFVAEAMHGMQQRRQMRRVVNLLPDAAYVNVDRLLVAFEIESLNALEQHLAREGHARICGQRQKQPKLARFEIERDAFDARLARGFVDL